jgi:hypothetical protein
VVSFSREFLIKRLRKNWENRVGFVGFSRRIECFIVFEGFTVGFFGET